MQPIIGYLQYPSAVYASFHYPNALGLGNDCAFCGNYNQLGG
jgi:hypothetical protein